MLLLPRRCSCCQRPLLPTEGPICLRCLTSLPRVHAEHRGNAVEQRLLGQIPIEHATAFCYYSRDSDLSEAIRRAKFKGRPWINTQLCDLFVEELRLAQSGWPYDIDCIVPIPLHWSRLFRRGYNQSLAIADSLHRAWQLPIETHCLQKHFTLHTQVGKGRDARLSDIIGSFYVKHPERLSGKHVLLVDDVLTTGATLVTAADTLLASVPGLRVSILTLTMAI